MTDAQIRMRVAAVVGQKLSANSSEVLKLYGDLIQSRGRNCADHFLTIHQLALRGGSASELDDAISVLIQSHTSIEPPIVISLHGIFTTGAWQKKLAPILTRAHMVPEPFDYGFYLPIRFLMPWQRERKIEWFLKAYTEIKQLHPNAAISICAHSFGTYIVGYAMLKYEQISFHQIILCGSILPQTFPWDQFIENKRVLRVLNEYGGKDSWAKRVKRYVTDSGPSGYSGFTAKCAGFFQRHYPRYKHSDFFHPLQFQQNWLTFLKGADPAAPTINYAPPLNKSFYLTIIVVVGSILAMWWFGPRLWHLILSR